jgi:hypothetical protein
MGENMQEENGKPLDYPGAGIPIDSVSVVDSLPACAPGPKIIRVGPLVRPHGPERAKTLYYYGLNKV